MKMYRRGRLALGILYCMLVGRWCSSQSVTYRPESYPDPQNDPDQCGHPANGEGWICDPDELLSDVEASRLDSLLEGIQRADICPCEVSCDRSYVVSVAIVKSIERTSTLEQDARGFANYLRALGWKDHGHCEENIVILYVADDRTHELSVESGLNARAQLETMCRDEVLDETRRFVDRGEIYQALRETIEGFEPYLSGERNCRGNPNEGGKRDLFYVVWIIVALIAVIGIIYLIICCFRKWEPKGKKSRRRKGKKKKFNSEAAAKYEAGVFGLDKRKGIDGPGHLPHANGVVQQPPTFVASAPATGPIVHEGLKITNNGGITVLEVGDAGTYDYRPEEDNSFASHFQSNNVQPPNQVGQPAFGYQPQTFEHEATPVNQVAFQSDNLDTGYLVPVPSGEPHAAPQIDPPSLSLDADQADVDNAPAFPTHTTLPGPAQNVPPQFHAAHDTVASYNANAVTLPQGFFGNNAASIPGPETSGGDVRPSRPRHNYDTVRDHAPDVDVVLSFGEE